MHDGHHEPHFLPIDGTSPPPPPLDNPLQDINQQLRDVFTPLSKFASEEIMVLVNYGQLPFTEKIITWVSAFLPQEYFVK